MPPLTHPVVVGALSGFTAAAYTDFQAFRTWKCFHDAATYAWGLAFWRWFQGIVTGAVSATGIWAIS